MKKQMAAVAVAGTLAMTGVLVSAGSASADTPGCVTRAEYRNVHKGMTKARVAHIFDTSGKRLSRATSGGFVAEVRSYNTCSRFSSVVISFSKTPSQATLHLDAKSAVWVS